MNEYTLDFLSPDPEYFIATSFYRDEIYFLVTPSGLGTYPVCMQTLQRVQQHLQFRDERSEYSVSAECRRGLILVNYLDMDSLNNAIQQTLSQNFFPQQRTMSDLPFGPYGRRGPTDKARHLALGSPRKIGFTAQTDYSGQPLEHTQVNVQLDDGTQYVLRLLSPEAVTAYFQINPSAMYLTVPGLVVVQNLEAVSLQDVVDWCHQKYFIETLQPVSLPV